MILKEKNIIQVYYKLTKKIKESFKTTKMLEIKIYLFNLVT